MKCDLCENKVTNFFTVIVKGRATQVNLCEKCTKAKGITKPADIQLASFLFDTAAQKKDKDPGREG